MNRRLVISLVVTMLCGPPSSVAAAGLSLPVEGYYDRQTVNGFGTHVTPEFIAAHRDGWPTDTGFKNDFTGYHAAVDLEFTTPAEAGAEIPVTAVADGVVIYRAAVTGYGGLIVLRHTAPESVTTLYGHLRLSDAPVQVGQTVTAGQTLGYLGAPFSEQTSGARKHLHFGIHRGSALDINGYAPSPAALTAGWHDPNAWLAAHGLPRPSPTPPPTETPASPAVSPSPAPAPPRGFWGTIGHFFESLGSSIWDSITD